MKNDDVLSAVRWPAITRLHELGKRVTPEEMTPQEVLALVAVLESDCYPAPGVWLAY